MLCFWLAYILTRPLGANIGDFLASPQADGGLGLGTLGTSVLFLGTILAVVVYLTKTRKDSTEAERAPPGLTCGPSAPTHKEMLMSDDAIARILVVTDQAASDPRPARRGGASSAGRDRHSSGWSC